MNSTRERCAMVKVVMFEEREGVRHMERSFQILVHPDSSVKTVERLGAHLRTTYAVPGTDRVRVTREMWESNAKCVHLETVGVKGSRKFVVNFEDPEAKPKWVDVEF
jgi:hypothetical protein